MNFPDIQSVAQRGLMPDIQGTRDHRELPIDQVGVRGVRYPVLLRLQDGSSQPSVGDFSLSVGLPAEQKGTHMSRFVELLESLNQQGIALSAASLRTTLADMLGRLSAETGCIEVAMPFFIMKAAPVSGVRSLMDYRCQWTIEQTRTSSGLAQQLSCEVKVPVKSLCPCSKEISEYGAHNQRSEVTVKVRLAASAEFSVEDLVRAIEAQASCELWGLLKRPDEKYVTERAYDNPKFVEDLVRDVAVSVRRLPGVQGYTVEAENFESIHNHSAWARIVG